MLVHKQAKFWKKIDDLSNMHVTYFQYLRISHDFEQAFVLSEIEEQD